MTIETYYTVDYAEYDNEIITSDSAVVIQPSKEIDDRTKRSRTFPSKEAALDWAKKYDAEYAKYLPEGKKWLAYIVVCKVEKEVVEKVW